MFNTKEEIFINSILAAVFAAILILVIISIAVVSYRRRLAHLRDRKIFEQTVLETQMEIREQTLQHIAEEIHDNISQTLSLAKMNLSTLPQNSRERAAEKIEQSSKLISQAIIDLRTLSRSLNTEKMIASGPIEAIRNQLIILQKTGAYKVTFNLSPEWKRHGTKTDLIIVRMFQECLQNIIKHADASAIDVTMEADSIKNCLTIKDNGKGFSMPVNHSVQYGEGTGLFNLHNRARLINAQLKIIGGTRGTTVILVIPNNLL